MRIYEDKSKDVYIIRLLKFLSENKLSDSYIEWRKHENIRSLTLPNKEKIYCDLQNIEHSWSGRMDIGNIGNTFIIEAEQLLINAIELFELGYFDCAYYSLRSAVDLSTTIVYLADMPDEEKELLLDAWRETKDSYAGTDDKAIVCQRQCFHRYYIKGRSYCKSNNQETIGGPLFKS